MYEHERDSYFIQFLSDGSFISEEVNGRDEYMRFSSCAEAGEYMDGLPVPPDQFRIVPEDAVYRKNMKVLSNDGKMAMIGSTLDDESEEYVEPFAILRAKLDVSLSIESFVRVFEIGISFEEAKKRLKNEEFPDDGGPDGVIGIARPQPGSTLSDVPDESGEERAKRGLKELSRSSKSETKK